MHAFMELLYSHRYELSGHMNKRQIPTVIVGGGV